MPTSFKNRKETIDRDGGKCRRCERSQPLHVHHIIAIQDGGSDDLENLITLCAGCHSEWHLAELVSKLDFWIWFNSPTYTQLWAIWYGLKGTFPDVWETLDLMFSFANKHREVQNQLARRK